MMDCIEKKKKTKKHNHPAERLTDDLVMEIFPRLPVKSLLRFKCVSKTWHALLSDRQYRKKLLPAMCGIFYQVSDRVTLYISIQKNHDRDSDCSTDIDLSFLPSHCKLMIYGCCNGLLLFHGRKACPISCSLYICNPASRRWAAIPNPQKLSQIFLLAFDPGLSRHYSVLSIPMVMNAEYEIFSSKTGKWVKSQGFNGLYSGGFSNQLAAFCNGIIHLLDSREPVIVGIDLEKAVSRRIELPHPALATIRCLGQSGGLLHYALKADDQIHVWVLEDYDRNVWVLKHSVSLQTILEKEQVGSFHPSSQPYSPKRLEIMAFHTDLDVIFLRIQSKLLSYHLITANLAEVCCLKSKGWLQVFPYSPCYSEDLDL